MTKVSSGRGFSVGTAEPSGAHWDYLDELGLETPPALLELAKQNKRGASAAAAALLPVELVEAMVLAGNPERVARQLARALHPRITQVTLRPHAAPGQPVAAVIRAFAETVLPRAMELRAQQEPTRWL